MEKEMASKTRNVCCGASMTIYCLISFVLLKNVVQTKGFAFEKQPSAKFQPPATVEELEFGFTLAYEQETFLVGSPRSSENSEGALYSCPLAMLSSGSRVCSKINIAGSGASGTTQDVCSYDADWQRLGSSLAVSGNKILTCAPNWNNTCTKVYGDKYSTLVGKCFYSTNGVQGPFSSIIPVYDWKTGTLPMYHIKDGRCQVGFGSHFLQASNEMVLGAPGCTSWIGDVFQGPLSPEGPYVRRGNSSYTAGLLDPSSENPNAPATPGERYLGYAVASITFAGRAMTVASAPKESLLVTTQGGTQGMAAASTYLLEKVSGGGLITRASLFTSQENNFLFAYCGYSLAVGDFDDNGLEDVVVGCPQYDKDKGAIVIFYQKKSGKSFKMKMESQHRFGLQPEARFGSSISWIEDVDGDGYRELAVGAPGVDDVVGSVHIFCGRLGVLPTEPCQILRAEEGMRNFGWAIASGSGNLAVSAYGQSVAVFKRLPVILASVEVLPQSRLPYEMLGPVNVSVCLSYTFRRSSDVDDSGRWFNAMLRLDDGVGNPRLIFEGTKESTKGFAAQVKANSQFCKNYQVMLQTRSQNPYAQYKLTANASLVANQPVVVPVVPDYRVALRSSTILVHDLKCDGSTCFTKATLDIQGSSSYTYKADNPYVVEVTLAVEGDTAYLPKIAVNTNGLLSHSKGTDNKEITIDDDGTLVVCTYQGSLNNETKNFALEFLPSKILKETATQREPKLDITANFTSLSNLTADSRVVASLTSTVQVDVKSILDGRVEPANFTEKKKEPREHIMYNFTLKNEDSFPYDVTIKLTMNNDTKSECLDSFSTAENSQCQLGDSNTGSLFVCTFPGLGVGVTASVALNASILVTEECSSPLVASAEISKLPFQRPPQHLTDTPTVTIVKSTGMETWKIGIIAAVSALVVMIVGGLAIFLVCKSQQKKDEADGAASGDDKELEEHEMHEGEHQGDEPEYSKPLKPQSNVP